MAESFGNLWEYNFCRVIVVDVSDDYRLMQPPMPSDYYPVLSEIWLPRYGLSTSLAHKCLVNGVNGMWILVRRSCGRDIDQGVRGTPSSNRLNQDQ